jgi:hypothetical protein
MQPPDVKLATMISTLRINYHIHRTLELIGLLMILVSVGYIYLFSAARENGLLAAACLNLIPIVWWMNRMSRHAIKARNAFREKLGEYERLYGHLT